MACEGLGRNEGATRCKGESKMAVWRLAGMVLAVTLFAGPTAAWAGKVSGMIVGVDPDRRVIQVHGVERQAGRPYTFMVGDRVRISRSGREVSFGNLVPGGNVTVHYRDGGDEGLIARSVIIHPHVR